MRRFVAVVASLVSVALLASCSFNPQSWLPRDDVQLAADRMAEIVEAINAKDVTALRGMFTEYALTEYSDEIDEGLTYLLSLFPNGDLIWENPEHRPPVRESFDDRKRTTLVRALYRVTSGGRDYWLYFPYFTVNDQDPHNIGIYGLGVTARTETGTSGPEGDFFSWAGSVNDTHASNPPSVYIPHFDNSQLSDDMMDRIVANLNTQDTVGLKDEDFAQYAQTQNPGALDDEIAALFALFPAGDVTWEPLSDEPLAREASDGDNETLLLLPIYQVSSGGNDYWLFFADYTVNTIHPDNLGLYAIGVAPRTTSGDSPQEQALFAWAETFDVDAATPAGIFIPE